jgi:hypothetical protein
MRGLTDLPKWVDQNVAVWREVGSKLGHHHDILRERALSEHDRDGAMAEFREEAESLGATGAGSVW